MTFGDSGFLVGMCEGETRRTLDVETRILARPEYRAAV